ncbi:hypothetical protein [Ruminococcus gauvreauii]|uniref:hypothetical protein n=1 Tax=Ruminococcus gauvreauii TaxID=438033 RepID=UPI00398456FC
MKYLVAETQAYEIPGRQEYLYDIFHLFFIPQDTIDGFILLTPLGVAESSILFVVGHYDQIAKYLAHNIDQIEEKTIVFITCYANHLKIYKKNKATWFTSFSKNEISYCYAGDNYGFGFEITESELNFYNSRTTDILKRIKENFKVL